MQRHNIFMRKSLQDVRLAQSRDGEALALRGVVRLDALEGPRVPRVLFRRLEDLPINALSHSFFVVVAGTDVAERPGLAAVFQGAHLVVKRAVALAARGVRAAAAYYSQLYGYRLQR